MLRSGYSSNAVMQELSARHFAEKLDAEKEKTLIQVGASAELITALKSGTYLLSPEQMTTVQRQIARERATARPQAPNANAIRELVKGDLISLRNGALGHFDDEALEKKKLIALYFSAHWCPPCRKFTPELVDYYNRVATQHPEFEIVFISFDKSQFAMETYMREANMPWPAIDFPKLGGKEAVRKYAGKGIPCLVLVDATGTVISSTYAGAQYLGPAKVLGDLDAIFAGKSLDKVAQNR